jgi:ribonuclease HI
VTSKQKSEASDRKPEAAEWKRMRFKKNKVWLATDTEGSPLEKDGKVLIKYQLEQDYEYWVKKAGVAPLDSPSQKISQVKIGKPRDKPAKKVKPNTSIEALKDEVNADTICIYTDGASSGNPGPSGIGVVMRYGNHEKEISKFIGNATNNIAELKAIEAGLLAVKNTDYPVKIYTDSNYAFGVLSLGWKSKKNTAIVASIKKTMAKFKNLAFFKVKGHAGNKNNERADFLATSAIKDAEIQRARHMDADSL